MEINLKWKMDLMSKSLDKMTKNMNILENLQKDIFSETLRAQRSSLRPLKRGLSTMSGPPPRRQSLI